MLLEASLALRSLMRRPAAPASAAIVIAIGIALATTVFAMGDPYLTRPLPYADARRVVTIDLHPNMAKLLATRNADLPTFADWQERGDLFVALAAYGDDTLLRIRVGPRVVPLRAVPVSHNFLATLGVVAPSAADFTSGAVWLAAPAAARVGLDVRRGYQVVPLLPSGAMSVIGTLPETFVLPQADRTTSVDGLFTFSPERIATISNDGGAMHVSALHLVARLRPGVTPQAVQAALSVPLARAGFTLSVTAVTTLLKERLQSLAFGALLAGALVLLVCCANAAGIGLTRGLHRTVELGMFETLGATRRRVAELLISEAVIVGGVGTTVGLGLGVGALRAVDAVLPMKFATLGVPTYTRRVVLFAAVAGLFTIASWAAASLMAWSRGRDPRRIGRESRSLGLARFALISGQITAAAVLLGGAGLLGRSYWNLARLDTGFDGASLALTVSYPPEDSPTRVLDAIHRTLTTFRQMPGIVAAAASTGGDSDRFSGNGIIVVGGRPLFVERTNVTSGFFQATGMQFIIGRAPTAEESGQAVVLNEQLARRAFPDGKAVGRTLIVGSHSAIVSGVVRGARDRGLTREATPALFAALETATADAPVTYSLLPNDASTFTPPDWDLLVQRSAPGAVVLNSTSLQERLSRSIRDRSFATVVMTLFAFATTVITTAGLVGIVGYVVARRTHEIGIRLAIGARGGQVIWLVMRDAIAATATGAVLGTVIAAWLSHGLEALLYGVSAGNLTTLSVTTVGLIFFALIAAAIPARRAGRLSTTVALRAE